MLTPSFPHVCAAPHQAKEMAKGDILAFRTLYLAYLKQSMCEENVANRQLSLARIRMQHAQTQSDLAEMEIALPVAKACLAALVEGRSRLGMGPLAEEVRLEAELQWLEDRMAERKVDLACVGTELRELEALVASTPDFAAVEAALQEGLQKLLADLDDKTSKISQRIAESTLHFALSKPVRKADWARDVMIISAGAVGAVVEVAQEQARLAKVDSC